MIIKSVLMLLTVFFSISVVGSGYDIEPPTDMYNIRLPDAEYPIGSESFTETSSIVFEIPSLGIQSEEFDIFPLTGILEWNTENLGEENPALFEGLITEDQTMIIGGHNHGIFKNLHHLAVGDEVIVEGESFIIDKIDENSITEPINYLNLDQDADLVLITCHGSYNQHFGTFDERIVVRASRKAPSIAIHN